VFSHKLVLGGDAICQQSGSQTPASATYTSHLSFDTVSIRQNLHSRGSDIFNDPRSSMWEAHGITVDVIILGAYGPMRADQLRDNLSRKFHAVYDVTAKADAETNQILAKLDKADFEAEKRHMLQLMLAERFHLRIHHETQQGTVYELVATPHATGLLKPVAKDSDGRGWSSCTPHFSKAKGVEINSIGCPFHNLVDYLSQGLQAKVTDRTGFSGPYAFHLMYRWPAMTPGPDDVEMYPDIMEAVREQLGLKLIKTQGEVTTWVVDQVEPPTPN
jgi:uncharacterized protein (TIGR03435 family)